MDEMVLNRTKIRIISEIPYFCKRESLMRKVWGLLGLAVAAMACTPEMEVSGEWGLCLDPAGVVTVDSLLGERADSLFADAIVLPGTTDLAGKGIAAVEPQYGLPVETGRLTRRHSFVGKAWYRKKVVAPYVWREKELALYLERTKATKLYLDGALVDSCNDVSTPQLYNLGKLRPGVHTIILCVDNGGGVPVQVIKSSHLYSDDTQTNWNGVIGRIEFGPVEEFSEQLPVPEMPRLEVVDGRFMAGGKPVFLRGKHDACVFPLTGHTPMDKASWINYFQRCKDYGINHVRFHSWCPPEAAFAAADELRIYLQPELPFWGTLEGEELVSFLTKEGLNIVWTYGHHPSFALFSLGNELWGEKAVMQEMVDSFRTEAPHILYTNGTNAFLGWQGYVDGMDFFATCRTRGEAYGAYNTHVRSSFAFCDAMDGGILNHFYPGTTRNFAEALEGVPMPVISHETGQFQSYPDYAQIDKYTGPLAPYNLMEFRRRLDIAGMAAQAGDFHRASLRWAFELYKADIEMCLRTPGLGGFQLLDIQDYPGQGSAYVGILDAFMDPKGDIDPAEWRQFCSELVPLAEFGKYCWSEDEVFHAHVKVANFTGEDLVEGEGEYEIDKPVSELLDTVKAPARIDLRLSARTAGYEGVNSWPIWVYPADNQPDRSGITIVRKLDNAALKALEAGKKVLLMPSDTTGTVGGLFQTDYWNYLMFKQICESNGKPVSPGTLGILTDPAHPLFREFPTEEHTDWQWFPVLKASRPMILDALRGYKPIVQVIDNVERNHRLGLVFEFAAGKGKLLVCCSDLESVLDYPEGRQFYKAILDYMRSDDFQPSVEFDKRLFL
jgi:hypothetical protein